MRLTPQEAGAELQRLLPLTLQNAREVHAVFFAPWVQLQEMAFLEVQEGRVKARLGQDPAQQFFSGAICGQAMMLAIDTVMSMAMLTYPRYSRGTVSQNTQFLRPAITDDLILDARVLKMGSAIGYGETSAFFEGSGKLVAHSTSEFAFSR